jgi:transmembrane sensor
MERDNNDLLKKYEAGECTPEEAALVESWYTHALKTNGKFTVDPAVRAAIKKRTWNDLREKKSFNYAYLAAATVILLLSVGGGLLYTRQFSPSEPVGIAKAADIQPGGNKAILTLGDGTKIALDSVKNGQVANLPGVTISKSGTGQLIYKVNTQNSHTSINTITTPNGGQYQIILPDGSKVYLNAASSLTYPTQFAGNERKVSLIGEGYFEVTKDASRPFKVESLSQIVTVIGTHFNVSCYTNEQVRTTLAEGKVQITQSSTGKSQPLIPGQQSTLTPQGIDIKPVSVDNILAWKDGLFIFNQTQLSDALRQICRWYDVDAEFSSLPDKKIYGEFSRNVPLSEVLHMLSIASGIDIQRNGRTLIVK